MLLILCTPLSPSSCFLWAMVFFYCLCPSGYRMVSPSPSAWGPSPTSALFTPHQQVVVDQIVAEFRFLETQSQWWRCHLWLKCWVVAGAAGQVGLPVERGSWESWTLAGIPDLSRGATKTLVALGMGTWEQPWGGNVISVKVRVPWLGEALSSPSELPLSSGCSSWDLLNEAEPGSALTECLIWNSLNKIVFFFLCSLLEAWLSH